MAWLGGGWRFLWASRRIPLDSPCPGGCPGIYLVAIGLAILENRELKPFFTHTSLTWSNPGVLVIPTSLPHPAQLLFMYFHLLANFQTDRTPTSGDDFPGPHNVTMSPNLTPGGASIPLPFRGSGAHLPTITTTPTPLGASVSSSANASPPHSVPSSLQICDEDSPDCKPDSYSNSLRQTS